ncbi:MAG: hypothetical protein AB7R55_16585 [Gemmatimonadales bacterium]
MADFDFSDPRWLRDQTKPFDRLMPFRRIRVPPGHRFVEAPSQTAPNGPFLRPDGKGYDCGCRSTKDYDGAIGKEIGRAIGDFISAFTGRLVDAAKNGLKGLISVAQNIPVLSQAAKKVIEAIDEVDDPFRALFGELGKLLDALLIDSIIRSLPSWVPALRRERGFERHEEQEVDGVLLFSRIRHDSIPFAQWHHWYDWSFVLVPSPFFQGVVGFGNTKRDENDNSIIADLLRERPSVRRYEVGHQLFRAGRSINAHVECEVDLGAFTDFDVTERGRPESPVLNPLPASGGRFWRVDWGWPLAGQYFWASGRSVYDCSHATDDNKLTGLHLNQLHPCKAIASARWEGFQFLENERAVPAIQFTFFASNVRRSGGNFLFGLADVADPTDQGRLDQADYDFIVDLPDPPPAEDPDPPSSQIPGTPFPIGAAPTFMRNTAVLRPRLLIDVNFNRFDQRAGSIARSPRPLIEPVPPDTPDQAPRQVRVRIPLKQLQLSAAFNTYAVMITMGWHDPKVVLAKRVRKVTVRLQRLTYGDPDAVKSERWLVNVGINGRWMNFAFDPIILPTDPVPVARSGQDFAVAPLVLFLADDDNLMVSVNGFAESAVGTIFNKPEIAKDSAGRPIGDGGETPPPDTPVSVLTNLQERFLTDRRLRFSHQVKPPRQTAQGFEQGLVAPFIGRVAQWDRKRLATGETAGPDIDQTARVEDEKLKTARASELARQLFLRIGVEGGFGANRPLGLIDPMVPDPTRTTPSLARRFDRTDTANPLRIGDIPINQRTGRREVAGRLSAYRTEPIGRLGPLGYDSDKMEYQITYSVTVEDQLPVDPGVPLR